MYDQILSDPSWWRALPLQRRRGAPQVPARWRADGARRLALWRDGVLFPSDPASLDRWHDAGITDDELAAVLGEPAESLAARLEPPDFLAVIAEAWRRYADFPVTDLNVGAARGAAGQHHDHDHDHDHDQHHHEVHDGHRHDGGSAALSLGFLELARPLLAWAHETLRARVARLSAAHGRPAPLPHSHPLFRLAPDRLMSMVSRTMVLELNVARVEGRLTGTTPEERFASFIQRLHDPANALTLLAEYPVLAREIVDLLRRWVEVRAELAERLLTDLPELRRTFGVTADGLDDLVDIRFGVGDSHRGGRTVAVVTFPGGDKLVYKPRSISVETHFNALLDWLNARGLTHPLRTLRVMERDSHGWVEFVAAAGCADEAEARRFFWRHGAYLALFYAIRGSDFHLENVIAAGEHPMFVDLEAIFQSPPKALDTALAELLGAAPAVLHTSVLGSGLLPQRIIEMDENGFRDTEISALAGSDKQLTPDLVPTFAAVGTDQMHAVRERLPMSGADNLATLDGEAIDPRRYRGQIMAGFESCYRLLQRHRESLLAADSPIAAFRGDQVRFVPRPTKAYVRMLFESFHPDVLRDSLDREYLFEAAVGGGHRSLPDRNLLLASELRQLAEQDVPCFHTTTDSVDLHDDAGVVIRGFLDTTGMDAARNQLNRMSDDDLGRQLWCIEASFAGLTVGAAETAPVAPVTPPAEPLALDHAVRAAALLGDQLLDSALVGDDEPPHWLSLANLAERYWTVGPAGTSLYDGTSGIALFLAHLAALSGVDRYRRPAERLAEQLAESLRRYRDVADLRSALPIGGYSGVGGMVYTLTALADLWDAPELRKPIQDVVTLIAERFDDDKALDIIEGAAGIGVALVGLYQVDPDERVLNAIRAAEQTLARRAVATEGGGVAWSTGIGGTERLLGFAHGASGFAFALARMATVTGTAENYELCAGALRFERQYLSRDRGNWPDLRSISPDGTYLNTWCHGAAGIGLARATLAGLPALDSVRELIDEDLAIAVGTVQADLVRGGAYVGIGSDCLCHGDLGLFETLYAAAPVLRRPDLATLGRRLASAVADRVIAGELRPGVPSWVPTPGLLMGTSGIGYGLLRAAAPDRVPNVLTLTGRS